LSSAPTRSLLLAAGLITALLASVAHAQRRSAVAPVVPETQTGSFGPDVYLDDITYTLRPASFRSATVSPHDSNVAYVSSWDGYLWKTIDGGRTWDESRLILDARSFYGDAGERLYFGVHRLGGGAQQAVELRPEGGVPRGHQDSSGSSFGGAGASGGTGAAANVNFGIGLPGGAPRLQLLVRKYGKPTAGLNIKQTLITRGTRPTEVRMIIVHPKYPNIVFACTAFGLYKTQDGGNNWVRTFTGMNPSSRFAFHLAVDPRNPKRILVGTGDGLWISDDLGESFAKSTQGGVGGGVFFWVYFDPYDPRYVFVTGDSGVLRSSDGGNNFEYIYYTSFPAARLVLSLTIDPFNKRRGYISTLDGLFTTPDILSGGLESWTRLGGLQFTGIHSEKIALCPKHRGHIWVMTNMRVPGATSSGLNDTGGAFIYESVDAGYSWKVIYSGDTYGSIQWFDNDPRDPDLLFFVWSRSLGRMRRHTTGESLPRRIVIPDDPPVADVIMAAQMYTGTDPGRQLRYRRRSLYKALLPKVTAVYHQYRWRDYALNNEGLFPTLPYFSNTGWSDTCKEFRVTALWDLGDLVFNLEAALFGRVDRLNYEVRENVKYGVHRMYSELRRLRVLMANQPPRELRVRLMYKLRIEELTSYINFITGNYLTRWKQGDRPSGIETKWWEPWTRDAR
jgi:hypothetical protein